VTVKMCRVPGLSPVTHKLKSSHSTFIQLNSSSLFHVSHSLITGVLRPDQMFFRPALVYQTMFDEHVADAGLEFSIGNRPCLHVRVNVHAYLHILVYAYTHKLFCATDVCLHAHTCTSTYLHKTIHHTYTYNLAT